MSASETQAFARKDGRELTFDLTIAAASVGEQPRPFVVSLRASDSRHSAISGSFWEHLHPDELRILARLLERMAARCDAVNESLGRGER